MPFISYPKAAYDRVISLAEELAIIECLSPGWGRELAQSRMRQYEVRLLGFWQGLHCCLPSETVGLLIMAYDEALETARQKETVDASCTAKIGTTKSVGSLCPT